MRSVSLSVVVGTLRIMKLLWCSIWDTPRSLVPLFEMTVKVNVV